MSDFQVKKKRDLLFPIYAGWPYAGRALYSPIAVRSMKRAAICLYLYMCKCMYVDQVEAGVFGRSQQSMR